MGLHREFSWPKLWERKGHRCAGLPRTLICTVWGSSPSQLAAARALESIYTSLWLCLCVGECLQCMAGAGWSCRSQSALHHWVSASRSLSTSLPRGSRAAPHHAREGGASGYQPGAHSSQTEKEKEEELQAGKMCDIRVTAEFIPQQVLACFSSWLFWWLW